MVPEAELLDPPLEPDPLGLEVVLLEDPQAATSSVAAIASAIAGIRRYLKITSPSLWCGSSVLAPRAAKVLLGCGRRVIDL
jgi:hypothetical protein